MTQKLNPNRKYTHKIFKGQLISTDWLIKPMTMKDHQEKLRKELPLVCEKAGIKLELNDPYPLSFPDDTKQIRSTFWVSGNYPEWYFYQAVNQVKPCPLDRV